MLPYNCKFRKGRGTRECGYIGAQYSTFLSKDFYYGFNAWHPFVLLSLITVLLVYGFARPALATPPAIDLILGRSGDGRAITAVRIGDDADGGDVSLMISARPLPSAARSDRARAAVACPCSCGVAPV